MLHGGDTRRDALAPAYRFRSAMGDPSRSFQGSRSLARRSLFAAVSAPSIAPDETYLAWTKFLGDIPAGSIGICQPNDHTVAHMGELSAETLKRRGIKGYVVDGGCRDTAFIRRIGFPVWCRYATPADIVGCWIPEGFGEPITIGSVRIRNGDYVLADDDGVVVIPADRAKQIVMKPRKLWGGRTWSVRPSWSGMNPQQAYLTYRKF